MSYLFSPFCTMCKQDGRRTDLAPNEGFRSKGWAYCKACYIRRFPKAAEKAGLISRPAPVQEVVTEPECEPVQLPLFIVTSGSCGCQG